MKYYEVDFTIAATEELMQDARDLLAAQVGEVGFESFEDTETGLKGYVQTALFDKESLDLTLQSYYLPGVDITYTVTEAEDRNWNEQWEQEGFKPIVVSSDDREISVEEGAERGEERSLFKPVIVIHDGRHLPEELSFSSEETNLHPLSIEIDTHLAFGTGNHETTRMMMVHLLSLPLRGKRVLDCGCGTGILGIAALKLGATEAVGYDIDEWSADNARHNAVINGVDASFTSLLGDSSILDNVEGVFNVVMANINRNILLADMPAFCSKLADGGCLLLSGFYTEDIPYLTEKAQSLGLTLEHQRTENDWASIILRK